MRAPSPCLPPRLAPPALVQPLPAGVPHGPSDADDSERAPLTPARSANSAHSDALPHLGSADVAALDLLQRPSRPRSRRASPAGRFAA
eukprot:546068-Prymnesium_polylepis.1